MIAGLLGLLAAAALVLAYQVEGPRRTLVVGSLLVLSFTYALLFRLLVRRCGNPLVAIGLTGVSAAGASMHWLARPHLFSWLLGLAFIAVAEQFRRGAVEVRWLGVLPLLAHAWGAPLGEAVAEDFDFIHHAWFSGDPSLLDGGGSSAFCPASTTVSW